MCGIVGYIGSRDATPIILNGLKRLEYRGYDSAGLAIITDGHLEVRKDAGKLSQLIDLLYKSPISGAPGIGHTRWATHGAPNARNAHPHVGQTKRVVVVQNGIVENFLELKDELIAEGVEFQSETDTETIVHLVEHYLAAGVGLVEAARKTFNQIRGANVVVLMSVDEPDKIVAARIGNAGGVVLGLGDGENFIASDTPAIMEHTRNVIFLESRQMAVVTSKTMTIETLDGAKVKPQVHTVAWDPVAAEKGEYRHFMQKEIHEQVRALTDTLVRAWSENISSKRSRASRWRWSLHLNSVIAIRFWTTRRLCWPFRNPAKPQIRWRRWRRRGAKAQPCGALSMRSARRPCAWQTDSSRCKQDRRSASPRPRPSRPRW
jgi:glutamine---fructose-6-phosphate transaminase (isomerizing)